MSKLEELIQRYCPEGVEYLSIGSLISRERTKGRKNPSIKTVYSVSNTLGLVKAEDFRDNVIYSEDTSNYTIVEQGMFAYNPARLNIGSLAWLKTDQPGLVSPMYVVFSINKARITPEFLFLHLKSKYVIGRINSLTESGARFRFDYDRWDLIEIPVPPIPVQKEIVKLLCTFTELQITLQSELEARKKQAEYYASRLFDLSVPCINTTMGSICEFVSVGIATSATHAYVNSGIPMLRNQNIKENLLDDSDIIYISREFETGFKNKRLKENDILVTRTGYPGIACVVPKKFEGCQTFTTLIGRLDKNKPILPKYICYYINSTKGKEYVELKKTGAAQQNFGAKELARMPIVIPSLVEQERIVSILDKFGALISDLTSGLPAEIEKRRQQYEYYRDKLLPFKRKEA